MTSQEEGQIAFDKEISAELNIDHAQHFDPLRYAFIQSLFQRIAEPQHASNAVLIEKVRSSAKQYKADLVAQRRLASETIDDISARFPQSLDAAQALFEQCEFRRLGRMSVQLDQELTSGSSIDALRDLTKALGKPVDESRDSKVPLTLEAMLIQQQENVCGVVGEMSANGDLSASELGGSEAPQDLQSMKLHRQSIKQTNVDKAIARAIDDSPENPGPHNPHMLVIDSLTQMRELSPAYSRRFAGYIETLLWLEKPGTKLSARKKRP